MKSKTSIIIIILVILTGLFAIAALTSGRSNRLVNEKRLEEINHYDLENDYPQTPFAVIAVNNNILSFLYSGSITDDMIEPVAKKQRQLFHEDFLALNNETDYVNTLKEEINLFKKQNYKLISITQEPPVYNPINEDACTVNVIQYTNAETKATLAVTYYLQQDDAGRWKILGFVPIEGAADSDE